MGLGIVLFIMKKYKTIFLFYQEKGYFSKFENKAKKIEFYFKYYVGLCVHPIVFSLYKIVYFSEHLNFDLKYMIYVLCITFLQTLKFFYQELIKELTDKDPSNDINKKIMKIIENKININNLESQNLIHLVVSFETSVTDDIEIINSPNFNLLDYQTVILIFLKNIAVFKDIKEFNDNDISKLFINKKSIEVKVQNVFRENLEKIYIEYVNTKEYFSFDYIAQIFLKVENKFIRQNNLIDFLSYYKANDIVFNNYYLSDISKFTKDKSIYIEILVKLFKTNPEYFHGVLKS